MRGAVLSTLKRDSQVKEKMCVGAGEVPTIVPKDTFNCIIMFYLLYQVAWIPI
jgi:hypothetical protein